MPARIISAKDATSLIQVSFDQHRGSNAKANLKPQRTQRDTAKDAKVIRAFPASQVAADPPPELQFAEAVSAITAAHMAMRKLLPCLLLICLAALPPLLSADTVVEEIIARVNNQIITRAEYLRSKEQLKQEAQQQDPANADKIVAEKDKDVLRDLIDQQLLLEKGKDLGITADTEVIKRLDEMRKQMKLESWKTWKRPPRRRASRSRISSRT